MSSRLWMTCCRISSASFAFPRPFFRWLVFGQKHVNPVQIWSCFQSGACCQVSKNADVLVGYLGWLLRVPLIPRTKIQCRPSAICMYVRMQVGMCGQTGDRGDMRSFWPRSRIQGNCSTCWLCRAANCHREFLAPRLLTGLMASESDMHTHLRSTCLLLHLSSPNDQPCIFAKRWMTLWRILKLPLVPRIIAWISVRLPRRPQ